VLPGGERPERPARRTGGAAAGRPAPADATLPSLPGPGLVNAANALTVLRLALVPVFIACLLAGGPGWRVAAFATFCVASVTDLLDGRIARRRGLITDFGKIADPIADKALTGAALVTLSALGELPWWVTAVILAREISVTVLRLWVIRRGVIAASRGGKLKTLLQVVAIALYVLQGPLPVVREVVMAAAVAVTLVTGVDYAVRAVRLRRRPLPRGQGTGGAGADGGRANDAAAGDSGTGGAGAGDPGAGGAGTSGAGAVP
jgi:CDP-diacylglycerol---glycerol-3-phosphate 3-phosphatidyltransferase